MRFIQNIDFEAIPSWTVARSFTQFADFIDTAIGGCVDLDHINRISGPDSVQDSQIPQCRVTALSEDRQFSAMARMRATVACRSRDVR